MDTQPDPQPQKDLATAIVTAQTKARAVAKDARNGHHGYNYASAEAIIDEARGALSDAGLALLTDSWTFEPTQMSAPSSEAKVPVGRIVVVYTLLHTSGQSRTLSSSTPVIPEKGRPADKAEFAAITANLAYMLRGLLLLPRDDNAAAIDARNDTDQKAPPALALGPATPGSPELEAQFVEEIGLASNVGQLPPIAARVDQHTWPPAAKERIKAAYAARKARLLDVGGNETDAGASQLADEFIASIRATTSADALPAIATRVQALSLPEADIARIKAAYSARKAELSAPARAA